MKYRCIVTCGWDDGHKLDLKLAKLLLKYKIQGTFFIPIHYLDQKLSENELIALSENFEIGSHTLTHPYLTKIPLNDAEREITESKKALEKILEREVVGLSYPTGDHNDEIAKLTKKADYKYAFALYKIGVHMYPHLKLRNVLKESLNNFPKFVATINPLRFMRPSILTYTKRVFDYAYATNGVFYLWGHSWEIEYFGMWDSLEKILKYISNRTDVLYVTNYEMTEIIRAQSHMERRI